MQKQIRAIIFLFALLLPSSMLLFQPAFVNAATTARSKSGSDALNFLDATAEQSGLAKTDNAKTSLLSTIGNIINIILGFVGIIFFIQLFWAGFRWMSAGGNEEVIKESKKIIEEVKKETENLIPKQVELKEEKTDFNTGDFVLVKNTATTGKIVSVDKDKNRAVRSEEHTSELQSH